MTNLLIHCGGHQVEEKKLKRVDTPEPTDTWFPIPHIDLLHSVRGALVGSGLNVVNQAHALNKDGLHYFGLMELESRQADYSTVVGLRNSHDQRFPAGMVVGSQVFVCDNLAFSGEVNVSRKHTRWIMRDLHMLIEAAMGRIISLRVEMEQRIEVYKQVALPQADAHHMLVEMAKARCFPKSKLLDVVAEFEKPSHEEFLADGHTAWTAMNAVTEVLRGRGQVDPRQTQAMHGILDAHCGIDGAWQVAA